jgi:hypothetical protein
MANAGSPRPDAGTIIIVLLLAPGPSAGAPNAVVLPLPTSPRHWQQQVQHSVIAGRLSVTHWQTTNAYKQFSSVPKTVGLCFFSFFAIASVDRPHFFQSKARVWELMARGHKTGRGSY